MNPVIKYGIRIALLAAVFGLGYLYCDRIHSDKEAARQAEFAKQLEDRLREHGELWVELTSNAADLAIKFRRDRDALERRNAELLAQIEEAELTKPPKEVIVERCERGEQDEVIVIGNPFGPEFVRLWNESGRADRHTEAAGTDPG